MYAVLGFIDGFGADTKVVAIFKTKQEAKNYKNQYQRNCRIHNDSDFCKIKKFDFGEVDFNIYD